MKTELDSAWESAIHNAERARKAEAEIERLQAELEECKQDAERYRWLRRARMNVDVVVRADEDSVWIDMHGCDLDTYVDASLAAEGDAT